MEPLAGSLEHGNETSVIIKSRKLFISLASS